ncbi:spermine synthase [Nitzschia inconspicua]|uniref:Spermine synthase n=1 Tax=Nitzschia inconspicua TaxID=303405 RepID=A0A9K3KNH9_9STRA|nr:spermine synthase [Nitzschia inconspicua]
MILPIQHISAILLLWSSSISLVRGDDSVSDPHLEGAQAIFDWVASSEGGIVNPKQEVRRAVPGDLSTPLIVAAKERIEAGEIMVRVPWENIIKPDDPDDDGQLPCSTATALAREMKLGKDSKYAPYVMYLNGESDTQIPSVWSQPAQDLFLKVLGDKEIPPARATAWISKHWYQRCGGDPEDKVSTKAALMVIQRSDDEIMIPAYDAYNHRNGKYTSTDTTIKVGNYHETVATRTIEAGEEIFLSYNLCKHCGGRKMDYGTGEMLRDYGFVEQYPRRFHYMDEYQFDLEQNDDGTLQVIWDKVYRPKSRNNKERTKNWMRKQIRRLLKLKLGDWNFDYDEKKDELGMTRSEWNTIWEFVDANIAAMRAAMDSLEDKKESSQTCSSSQSEEGTCDAVVSSHYDMLEEEWDDLPYAQDTCNFHTWMQTYKKQYPVIETLDTEYQALQFKEHPGADDICMELDKIVQICSNYRPHYHEYVTHAAARFVKDIRRVIFIGGGDSMLLHEALKYPNIEKVVGLELDQTVTRKSFKHFRTQPHFDNDKVEWWFGDATKSLLLLPEDYFGSFDLVLVDLSETVMSMSVTKELDVFDALSLLLQPNGVMVKNEMYKDKFNEVFDYTMELYYICPVICDQVLVFGSNNVDFFHAPTYDHGVETFLSAGNLHSADTRFDLMHHYKRNIAPEDKCNVTPSQDSLLQESAAGIIEILNAEKVSVALDESILDLVKSTAQSVGFDVTIDPVFDNEFGAVIMEEGYIAARIWPKEQYIAFDLNLWGKTYLVDTLKSALVKAVGSKDYSSYRVVVGGIYGSSTWKEDKKVVGPKIKQLRHCDEDIVTEGTLDDKLALSITVEEVVPLTKAKDITAAVVCGLANEECPSLKSLSSHSEVKKVIPIYECQGGEELESMIACEATVLNELENIFEGTTNKLNLVVLDGSASFKMHQIMNSIMVMESTEETFFSDHFIAVTWSPDLKGQTWRREFLDRLRKSVKWDPAVRIELVFQAGGKSYEAGIFSSKLENPAYDFEKVESKIQRRLSGSGARIELRHVHGALYRFINPYNPDEFKQADYDLEPGNTQYDAQVPLGRQSIMQFVRNGLAKNLSLSGSKLSDYLKEALKEIDVRISLLRNFKIGEGVVILATAVDGNFMVVWDGKEHVDVNFFTFRQSPELADSFKDAFTQATHRIMEVGLRDDQPRGTGRVVNFLSDIA